MTVVTRPKYAEDFTVGETFESESRLITERDLLHCLIWNGDGQAHSNEDWCQKTPWGRRIVHGDPMLGVGVGLIHRQGLLNGTLVGYEGMEIRYPGPIYPDDRISATLRINDVQADATPTAGRVTGTLSVRNDSRDMVAI